MGRRVQYKGTDAALKGAATFKKGAARHGGHPCKRIRVGGLCGQDSSGEWRVTSDEKTRHSQEKCRGGGREGGACRKRGRRGRGDGR